MLSAAKDLAGMARRETFPIEDRSFGVPQDDGIVFTASVELRALFGLVRCVPAAGLEGDLAEACGFAGEEELLLEAGEEELLELVEVGGGVDDYRQRAAVEGFEGAVVGEGLWDEGGPGLGDFSELGLALGDALLEEGEHFVAEFFGARGRGLFDLLEALEVDEGVVGGDGHGEKPD
jgi:hypothetical protein